MSASGGTERERDHTCDIEGVEVGRGAVTLCMRVFVSICISLKRLSAHIPLYLYDQQTAQDPTQEVQSRDRPQISLGFAV